jgi:hypothetical protein
MVNGRVLTAGMMLAFFVVMVAVSFSYPAEARFVPLVIGIPGLILALTQFVTELRPHHDAKVFTSEERGREFRMFGWFALFLVGIILFGFEYGGPVLVALYLHFSWHEKWYVSLGSAAFTWAAMYGIFNQALRLPLFEGLIIERYFY